MTIWERGWVQNWDEESQAGIQVQKLKTSHQGRLKAGTQACGQGRIQKAETRSGKGNLPAGKDRECEPGNWALRSPGHSWSPEVSQEGAHTKAHTNSVWAIGRELILSPRYLNTLLDTWYYVFRWAFLEDTFWKLLSGMRFWTMHNMKHKFFVNDFIMLLFLYLSRRVQDQIWAGWEIDGCNAGTVFGFFV